MITMSEQDPRYAGYVQRKEQKGQPAEDYDAWKARIDGLDKARAVKAAGPPNPDDTADDSALDAAQEMATIAEQKMALADARMAEAERMMQAAAERNAVVENVIANDLPLIPEVEGEHVNASELGPLTHVQASSPARVPARSVDEFEPDEVLHFSCPAHRNYVEIMQAGQKLVVNNSIVTLPHKAIEFTEHHVSFDLQEPEQRERAAWLLQSQAFRSGVVVLVPKVNIKPAAVRTGPRTSGVAPVKMDRPDALTVRVGA
jgi:hypothetical protein